MATLINYKTSNKTYWALLASYSPKFENLENNEVVKLEFSDRPPRTLFWHRMDTDGGYKSNIVNIFISHESSAAIRLVHTTCHYHTSRNQTSAFRSLPNEI